ncbi:clasp N terminal-domain-containing protein [Cunninghamella echinulata]|nr:clasp N terminal-domain-containing protein [Cunninghamella echinulata]
MIISNKDLEREFSAAIKYFQGKEAESNWEKRDQVLTLINTTLQDKSFLERKSIILNGIHDLVLGIADATKSLRTKYALVAFNTITSIGQYLGKEIDSYTFETLFIGLLQCSNSSKQIIANKAKETTICFLSTTTYHNKVITLLASAFKDKNNQVRHFTSIYMKTYLDTHIVNPHVRTNMERHHALHHIDLFLKAGLLDATPHVREVCRTIFWLYQQYYPARSEKILQSFDLLTRKQLEKLKPTQINSPITRKREASTCNLPKNQRLKSEKEHISTINSNNKQTKFTKTTQSSSKPPPPFRRTVSDSSMDKFTNQSKIPIPSSSSQPKLLNNNNNNNNNNIPPILASASLLHMLRSDDINANCNALRILADRLIPLSRTPLYENDILLPSTVPSRVDLIPVLLNYLSPERMLKNESLCNQLMSWDCLAGIFVNLLSLQHFIPTLILASHQECRSNSNKFNNSNNTNNKNNEDSDDNNLYECTNIKNQFKYYTLTTKIGLERLKLYLKYHYPNLIKSLLDILLMSTYAGGAGLKDQNAKKQLSGSKSMLLYNSCDSHYSNDQVRDDLIYGILKWIDELLCDYIGLDHHQRNNNNNNNNINNSNSTEQIYIMKGSEPWLMKGETNIATEWFKNNDNMELCFESILRLFKSSMSIHPTLFTLLISLTKRIQASNEYVYELVIKQLDDDDITKLLNTFVGNNNNNSNNALCNQYQNNQPSHTPENNIEGQSQQQQEEDNNSLQGTEELLYDEPPPSYSDVILQQQLEEDNNISNNINENSENQTNAPNQTPSSTTNIPEQCQAYDLNDISLELLSDEIDVLDTSYGSIQLDTLSPEQSLISIHEPSNINTINENEDITVENDDKKQVDTPVNENSTEMNYMPQIPLSSPEHGIFSQDLMNNKQMMDIKELLQQSERDVANDSNNKSTEKNIWVQPVHKDYEETTLFDYTLQKIIYILNHSRNSTTMDSLFLLRNLLSYQPRLFQIGTVLPFNNTLVRKLIYLHREKYTQISILIDDILDKLFKTMSINDSIIIIESLLEEEISRQQNQKIAPSSTTSVLMYVDPLDTLFNIISISSSRMTPVIVTGLLKKAEWTMIFIMGFNHSMLSIRKSCVNTLVSFSHVLNNEDIQDYLPGLKDEQRNLLDHYIQQTKKI